MGQIEQESFPFCQNTDKWAHSYTDLQFYCGIFDKWFFARIRLQALLLVKYWGIGKTTKTT